jgi:serine/threonine protein kinase
MYLHLSDFGIAKNKNSLIRRRSSEIGEIKGTTYYLAPEILNAHFSKPDISKQDVWAVGVIAYELCM